MSFWRWSLAWGILLILCPQLSATAPRGTVVFRDCGYDVVPFPACGYDGGRRQVAEARNGRVASLIPVSLPAVSTSRQFTGKERDSETGLDYFGARHFSGSQGRFTSADPQSAGADPRNPQSWNGYGYALNNPLAYVDPNGKWPFYVHSRMYQAFSRDFSPHQQALLGQVSFVQDFGPGAQDPAQSHTHSMCFGGQSPGSCVAMINRFIDQNLDLANRLSGGGRDLNDDAIAAFGKAVHALTDMGSPAHVGEDGTPLSWSNGRAAGLAHVYAERDAPVDWLRAGQSIRLGIAGFAKAFPYLAKKHGNQDAWARREIENFVSSYFLMQDAGSRSRVAEDAARQCALGNAAACGDQ